MVFFFFRCHLHHLLFLRPTAISVPNFSPFVLFILSSSPNPYCLSGFFFKLLLLHFSSPPWPHCILAALFNGRCTCVVPPSGDRNIRSSACLKTSGGREILITAALHVHACADGLLECVCARVSAGLHTPCLCVNVHICARFGKSNPDYTHLPVSHFRRTEGEEQEKERGWGEKRESERKGTGMRDVLSPPSLWTAESHQWLSPSTLPPTSPQAPGVSCIGRPAAQTAFESENNREHQLSLQEDYAPWEESCLFHHMPPSLLFFFSSFVFSLPLFLPPAPPFFPALCSPYSRVRVCSSLW